MKPVWINAILLAAIAIDVTLSVTSAVQPRLWFSHLHVGLEPDALHITLLRRAGAQWAAFALLQLVALMRWRRRPGWLLLVAGARLSDLFTDLTYLALAPALASSAVWELSPPSVLNLGMALLCIAAYRNTLRIDEAATGP